MSGQSNASNNNQQRARGRVYVIYPPNQGRGVQHITPPMVPQRITQDHPGVFGGGASGQQQQQARPSFQANAQQAPGAKSAAPPAANNDQLTNATVSAHDGFNARADAEALNDAMKGMGANEKALFAILCKRTFNQRCQIAKEYKAAFGQDLEAKFKEDTSGDAQKVLIALTLPRSELLARELFKAMEGLGTDEATLIEVLCSGNNQEIKEINEAYIRLYGNTLEQDIIGDTSGSFKNLLVSLAQAHRDESAAVDEKKVKEDAARLYQAGEARLGTDDSTFNNILATRSWAHLRQLMVEYEATTGSSLENAVEAEFSFDAEKALLGILHCSENRPAFFARRLNRALRTVGTDDAGLVRILVSRSEIDMQSVKQEYQKLFGKSLEVDVMDKTSGVYQDALLSLMLGL